MIAAIIIIIINLLLLWIGIYSLALKVLPSALRGFATSLILLTLISFCYYLSLILSLNFGTLTTVLTVVNLVNLCFTGKKLKDLYLKLRNGTFNYDVIPFVAVFIVAFFFLLTASKYGFFDGWALWNSHAKFLYYPDQWRNMFADTTYESSADYPLMLPALVAFFWRMMDSQTFVVPLLLSFSALAAVPILLYNGLKTLLLNKQLAVAAMAMLLTDKVYLGFLSEQCADIPLSVFMLMTFVLYSYLNKSGVNGIAYVLGFICATCMWIKNEGILFFVIFSTGMVVSNYKTPGIIIKYLAGAALPVFITLSYKLLYAPDTAFFSLHSNTQLMVKLKDSSRYLFIAEKYASVLVQQFWVGLLIIITAAVINRRYFKSLYFTTLLLMLAGYTFVYLISPYHLGWHIFTSFHRLMNQLYPSLIFSALLFCDREVKPIKDHSF